MAALGEHGLPVPYASAYNQRARQGLVDTAYSCMQLLFVVLQLAVFVSSGSNEGVCFGGGLGRARLAFALCSGPQHALCTDNHNKCCFV